MKKPYLFAPIYALIFLVVSITSGHAQSNIKSGDKESSSDDLTKTEKINSLVSTFANYGQFEGAVLVVEKGKIIYKNGFGIPTQNTRVATTIPTTEPTQFVHA